MAGGKDFTNRLNKNRRSALDLMGVKVDMVTDAESERKPEMSEPGTNDVASKGTANTSNANIKVEVETTASEASVTEKKNEDCQAEPESLAVGSIEPRTLDKTSDVERDVLSDVPCDAVSDTSNTGINDTAKREENTSSFERLHLAYADTDSDDGVFDNRIDASFPDIKVPAHIHSDVADGRTRPRSGSVIGRGVKKTRIQLLLSQDLSDALSDLAAIYNMSRNEVINRILINYIKDNPNY